MLFWYIMHKDFKKWTIVKESTHEKSTPIPYFEEGDIWWVHLGTNIGYEIDGKGENFSRPVLIIKKYNLFSFVCIPLSSKPKIDSTYVLNIGLVSNKKAVLQLSQIRTLDSRRLIKKIHHLTKKHLVDIKQKINLVLS